MLDVILIREAEDVGKEPLSNPSTLSPWNQFGVASVVIRSQDGLY